MSHKHKAKLEKLFEHPVSGNINIRRLLGALEHYGVSVEITRHNKAKIFFRDEEFILPITHKSELSIDYAIKLKHYLEKVDLVPGKL
jgi:hypothetical protein